MSHGQNSFKGDFIGTLCDPYQRATRPHTRIVDSCSGAFAGTLGPHV